MNVLNIAMKEFYTSVKSKRFVVILAVYLLFVFLIAYSIKGHFLELTEPQVSRTNLEPFGAEGDTYMTPLSAMLLLNFTFFTIFGAVMGAALGADAINKEVETGTIKVLLGHPVYRDEVINGKFFGNTLVLTITILMGYVFTIAFLLMMGVPLDGESFFRGLIAFIITLLYTLVFLSISILFSTIFKKSETSMLVSVGTAIFLTLIYGIIVTLIAGHLAGEMPPYGTPAFETWRENVKLWEQRLRYINPTYHYAKLIILVFSGDRITNAYAPLSEAFSFGFNNLAMLLVALLLPFAFAYVRFMTSELR